MSIRICLGHNSYIYTWISKLFNTIFVLGDEKCHWKHILGRLKVNVTLEGHINELFWAITLTYMHGFQNDLHRCPSWRVKLSFETFVHARTLTLPLPSPVPPPPPPLKKKKDFFCQIRISCQFIEKYSPPPPPPKKKWILCQKIHLPLTPPPPHHSRRPHTPPPAPHPTHIFLIWIICQLDSVSVFIHT